MTGVGEREPYPFTQKERDPLMPLVDRSGNILIAREEETGLGGLTISGIIYSETAPLAVINDEVVTAGDKVGGYVIVEITPQSVSLQKGNEGFTLKLEEE